VDGWRATLIGAIAVGTLTGIVGTAFRWVLVAADGWRAAALAWAHTAPFGAIVVVGAAAGLTGLAVWLVQRLAPETAGSGIPRVEEALASRGGPAGPWTLPVKFVGGTLAMGTGLALGREGPTVQMGATIGDLIERDPKRTDAHTLLAAGAGAGIATAFDAPLAGVLFVVEELTHRFETRLLLATMVACATAAWITRTVFPTPLFVLPPHVPVPLASLPLHLALGLVAGVLGVVYNRALLATVALSGRGRRLPRGTSGLVVGALVGWLAWYAPALVGGGEPLVQRLLADQIGVGTLVVWILVRFPLSVLSYGSGAPGGLFAPLLALGALTGGIVGRAASGWFPSVAADHTAFVAVGTAAYFTAVVRSPLTGVALLAEMTGRFSLVLPMLMACLAAHLVATIAGEPPIYDALRDRDASAGTPTRSR